MNNKTHYNNGNSSLLRNFITEIPRTFTIFGSIAENPRGFSRNKPIAKPLPFIAEPTLNEKKRSYIFGF